MKEGERVGVYTLSSPLGKGTGASTWIARSEDGGDAVLKALDIGEASDWAAVDQFKREAAALRGLSHSGIPRYLDSFEDSSPGRVRLVLVMELVQGSDLEKLVEGGRRFSDDEVMAILADLAEILAYLASLRPPVVHRDVNPRNIMLRPDGSVALVDFSCAQDSLRRGATLVGTAGYTPVEQVAGKATHKSDLYAAAATAIFLLSRRNPAELPLKGLKPDLESLGPIAPKLRYILNRWLEADEAKRILGAAEAARILRGESPIPVPGAEVNADGIIRIDPDEGLGRAAPRQARGLPSDSRIKIAETDGRLRIVIPPGRLANPGTLGMAGFALFWNGFIAFWTFSAAAMHAPVFFLLFSIPFWAIGIGMAAKIVSTVFGRTEIGLDPEGGLTWTDSVFKRREPKRWPLSDLGKCSIEGAIVRAKGSNAKEMVLEAGTTRLRLGRGLTERELRAIAARITDWLEVAHPSG